MKFDQQFRTFLGDVVNLNTNRLDQLDTHVKAITGTIETSDEVGEHVKGTHRQGSWRPVPAPVCGPRPLPG